MSKTVLILGASGRFGRAAAEAFWNGGWQMRRFDRTRDDLADAAQNADVIVNAWNPPYDKWQELVPALTEQVISAAQASGATVVVPGNVYVFGADAPEQFDENTTHAATNPLGRLRVDMERAYRDAGVRTIVLRAGDFLDTEASGNWFDRIIAARIEKGVLSYPGELNTPHAWAYLPDMAAASVALCDKRDQLQTFEDVPFQGYTMTGTELARFCEVALGRSVAARQMSWLPLLVASPFWPMARGILEMRYLWSKPHRLDGRKLAALLPDFAPTDPVAAIASALQHKIDPDKPVTASRAALTAQ